MDVSQDAIIALVGTLFGGAGLEIIRRALAKSKEKEDSATALRNELRTELTALKADMQNIERELDLWKQKYYELYERYVGIKFEYEAALRALSATGKIPEEFKMPDTPLDKGPVAPVASDPTTTKE